MSKGGDQIQLVHYPVQGRNIEIEICMMSLMRYLISIGQQEGHGGLISNVHTIPRMFFRRVVWIAGPKIGQVLWTNPEYNALTGVMGGNDDFPEDYPVVDYYELDNTPLRLPTSDSAFTVGPAVPYKDVQRAVREGINEQTAEKIRAAPWHRTSAYEHSPEDCNTEPFGNPWSRLPQERDEQDQREALEREHQRHHQQIDEQQQQIQQLELHQKELDAAAAANKTAERLLNSLGDSRQIYGPPEKPPIPERLLGSSSDHPARMRRLETGEGPPSPGYFRDHSPVGGSRAETPCPADGPVTISPTQPYIPAQADDNATAQPMSPNQETGAPPVDLLYMELMALHQVPPPPQPY